MESLGFLEVETPVRIQAPAPELHIDAEPSGDRFLAASPELQMKRLLASGGYPRIFQIGRSFRRGERGERHLPEFTMMEWYREGEGIDALRSDCEALVEAAARAVGSFPVSAGCGAPVRLERPWEAIPVSEAFERFAGWAPGPSPDPDRFDRDLVDMVEPALPQDRPVFLTGYPASMASLARLSPSDPAVAERFELYAGGVELANGFAELTDPSEQRRRFIREEAERRARGKRPYPLDERFMAALEAGLRPCAGIALGVDRLVMLLTGARVIDDVVAFPEGTT
jgi:lysyl-tRNA synthetase class 2